MLRFSRFPCSSVGSLLGTGRTLIRQLSAPIGHTDVLASAPPKKNTTPAVVFDVDGVLLRGKQIVPGAPECLRYLQAQNIPYAFVTNGGGVLEGEKAESMSKLLGVPVRAEQVLLAHSPMRGLLPKHKDDLILLVGKDRVKAIAKSYGFHNVIDVHELHSAMPLLFPDYAVDHYGKPAAHNPNWPPHKPIKAIFTFMDPEHYHRDLQLVHDVLRSTGIPGQLAPVDQQVVPLYCSGPDFEYVTEFALPRFGAGVFSLMLSTLYHKATGRTLQFENYGKPTPETYKYATRYLHEQAQKAGHSGGVRKIYAIGDNPQSDIKGANAAGSAWHSILVCTGMYTGGVHQNDTQHPAKKVVKDVNVALQYIKKLEGLAS